jgi:hypothetical protein
MFINVDFSLFCNAFNQFDDLKGNFSYWAKRELFNYLEDYEDSTGERVELDVVALCCDYYEDDIACVLANYNLDSLEELAEHTQVIAHNDDTVLYQVY